MSFMNRDELLVQLQVLFRDVLNNNNIQLTEDTSAEDIDEWTSLTHVQLITSMEQTFNIKFALREMMSWQNVGEIMDSIEKKL